MLSDFLSFTTFKYMSLYSNHRGRVNNNLINQSEKNNMTACCKANPPTPTHCQQTHTQRLVVVLKACRTDRVCKI